MLVYEGTVLYHVLLKYIRQDDWPVNARRAAAPPSAWGCCAASAWRRGTSRFGVPKAGPQEVQEYFTLSRSQKYKYKSDDNAMWDTMWYNLNNLD